MKKIIFLVVVIIAIGYFWEQRDNNPVPLENEEASGEQENVINSELVGFEAEEPLSQGQNSETYLVSYTKDGYSPKNITINVGDTIVFEGESAERMWTASSEHPTHTVYNDFHNVSLCDENKGNPEVFDQCGIGQSYAFTFNKTGEWGYHNHVQASHSGKVIVR